MITLIQNGTVIAWVDGGHEVLYNTDLVYERDSIIFIGKDYHGRADTVINATNRLVIPGFVNTHLHATDTPYTKGYLEEFINIHRDAKETNYGTLYKALPSIRHAIDPDAQVIASECAFAELAKSGSTTVVELGYDYEVGGDGDISLTEKVAQAAINVGLRCYSGPRFRSMHYGNTPDGGVWYKHYPNDGWQRFEDCVEYCASWDGRFNDRLRTMLAPGQIDTCTLDMLRRTRQIADDLKLPIQIHAGQSPNEFESVRKAHGMSTVEFMDHSCLLGPDLIVGHGQILTHDGDVNSLTRNEINLLRDSRTTVAHLPWVKARRGGVINSIDKYKNFGIRQSLGTDTFPFDMFNEMRFAAAICRVVEHSAVVALSKDVFTIATVGGADALNRPDLGRLSLGCKADIVLIRTDTFKASPIYDPFKFMVLAATGDDVHTVIVDGSIVVNDGIPVNVNVAQAINDLNKAAIRVRANINL